MEDLKTVERILKDQLEQLRNLSQSELVKGEPEQVVQISLAMVEIANTIISYQSLQEFDAHL